MNKPVFVRIDEYQDVLNIVDVIKGNLLKTKATIGQINDLKKKEDDILASWTTSLEDINKKVEDISKTLFEQQQ